MQMIAAHEKPLRIYALFQPISEVDPGNRTKR
jgi:hypothetical protein